MIGRERLLSEYIRWIDYGGRDVVMLRGGSVMMMLEIDGLPFETIDDALINYRHERLEHAIRDAAQIGLILHVLQCRGTADPEIYPTGRFRTPFAEQLDQRYRDRLFGTRSMWLNRTYLALELEPGRIGSQKVNRFLAWLARNRVSDPPRALIDRLRRIAHTLAEELKEYRPRILGVVERNRRSFSEIAEAVAFAMTGHYRQVPLTTSGAASIFSEVFIVGHEAFEIRMPHTSVFGACLGMREFPWRTEPGMFDRFLTASYRHTVFHAFRCLAATDGLTLASRKQNRLRQAGDKALDQARELTQAANLIAGNRLMMGEHAFALTLFVDERSQLPLAVQQAWGDLSSGGIKVERENIALEAVLFSMIPGNFHLRGRAAAVSSRNFAAFAALHTFPAGDRKGFWGDPVSLFRTSGGTPFLFHLHTDGVGNSLITGATGSGKSTLVGFLVCQAERSGAQIVLWDKDRGLEALVRALDGAYLSLTNAPCTGTGLAPLRRLTDSPDDLSFLSGLIRACISTPAKYDFTPEEDRRLGIALKGIMRLPPEDRYLEEVRSFLGTARDGAGARLEKWCAGGEFGWIIDCAEDTITLDGRVIGFDQSALLEDPIASGAVMATLFHYTGKLVDGRRLLFLLDEVWNALLIPQFNAEIRNGLKTWRKYNSPILIATQDVADALNSPIGDTIRSQTPTQFYFATPGAVWKYYGQDGMKLTETEFDIIQKLPKGTGHFLLKQGDRSVVAAAPLGGMSEVAVISGTRVGSDALKLARERTNDATGQELVQEYHRALEELTP